MQLTYSVTKDYEKAFNYLTAYTELIDKELSIEKFNKVEELERKYHAEKQTNKISTLTQKTKIQQLYVVILIIVVLLFLILAYFIFRKRKILHVLELAKQKDKIAQSALQGQENERKRISLELHDSVGGSLANISLRINGLIESNKEQTNGEDLDKIYKNINECFREIRRISHDLAPYKIEQEGLTFAIEELLDNLNEVNKTVFKSSIEINEEYIAPLNKSIIYRIVQELTTNIARHSKATLANVHIEQNSKELIVQVNDNGIGYNEKETVNGIGLHNIKTRVAYLNGKLEIVTEKGYGSLFTFVFPLNPESDY